jgi:predicted nucleotidyltransferase
MLEHVILPIRDRLRASGVERLGVFGSVARGDARPDSDVDVLVTFAPEQRTLDNLLEVGDAIEQAFHRRVDLITTDSLSPYIGPAILREVRYVDLGR